MKLGPLVFIFKVKIRHIRWGLNWNSYTLAAKNWDSAYKKVKKMLSHAERIESFEVLASTMD